MGRGGRYSRTESLGAHTHLSARGRVILRLTPTRTCSSWDSACRQTERELYVGDMERGCREASLALGHRKVLASDVCGASAATVNLGPVSWAAGCSLKCT